jgi:hypothetical protein
MQAGRLLAIFAFALLAGCTVVGTNYAQMSGSLPALKPGEGRVFFYTPAAMLTGDVQPEVRLNGTMVGFAVPDGFFFVDRPAGSYEASGATVADGRLAFTLATGETIYLRATSPFVLEVNRIAFAPVNAAQARAEMRSLVYSGITAPQ